MYDNGVADAKNRSNFLSQTAMIASEQDREHYAFVKTTKERFLDVLRVDAIAVKI